MHLSSDARTPRQVLFGWRSADYRNATRESTGIGVLARMVGEPIDCCHGFSIELGSDSIRPVTRSGTFVRVSPEPDDSGSGDSS
jgi:hypothetical protein